MPGTGHYKKIFTISWHRDFWSSVSRDTLFKRLYKNFSYLFIANVISSILGFIKLIIIARTLGVSNYGLLALVMVYVTFIKQLIDFRVWEMAIKYLSDYLTEGDSDRAMAIVKLAYCIDIITGILAFTVAILAAPVAASLFKQPSLTELAWIFALGVLFATTNDTSSAILRVFDRFSWISVSEITRSVSGLVLVLLMVALGYGIKGIIAASVLSNIIWSIILSLFSYAIIRSNLWIAEKEGKISILRDKYREIAFFLIHTNLSAIWNMSINRLNILILGYFRSTMEVGYFELAMNFVALIGKIIDPLYNTVFPEVTRLWAEKNVRKFNSFLKKLTIITSSIFIPLALCLFVFAEYIIVLTAGTEYTPAALSVRIMLWGTIVGGVSIWAKPVVVAIGKPILSNIAGLLGTVATLLLALIMVPNYGFVASSSLIVLNLLISHTVMISGYGYYLFKRDTRA